MKSNFRTKRLKPMASTTRRKRMLANNKKKIIWRNRAFNQFITD
ncbi:hypothetical protein [Vibrio profundum]